MSTKHLVPASSLTHAIANKEAGLYLEYIEKILRYYPPTNSTIQTHFCAHFDVHSHAST